MLLLVGVCALLASGMAFAGQENGVWVQEETDLIAPSTSMARTRDVVCLNFDEDPAPCLFADAYPLEDKYAALGVTFEGFGAIINECGNFGVTGFSSPNVLAFNCYAFLANGATPCTPETIHLSPTASEVSMLTGHGGASTVTVTARDGEGVLIDAASVTGGPGLQLVTLSAVGIVTVEIDMTGWILVIDDICIEFDELSSTESGSWGTIKSLYR